jgi:hypothetical protein
LPKKFLLYWTLGTSTGLILSYASFIYSMIILAVIAGAFSREPYSPIPPDQAYERLALYLVPIAIPLVLVSCLPLGIAQWSVLRVTRLSIRRWIPATVLGFSVGVAAPLFASFAPEGVLPNWPPVDELESYSLFLGASIGTAQWFSLRTRLRRSLSWIPLTTLSMFAAFHLVSLLGSAARCGILVPSVIGAATFGYTSGLLIRYLGGRFLRPVPAQPV